MDYFFRSYYWRTLCHCKSLTHKYRTVDYFHKMLKSDHWRYIAANHYVYSVVDSQSRRTTDTFHRNRKMNRRCLGATHLADLIPLERH